MLIVIEKGVSFSKRKFEVIKRCWYALKMMMYPRGEKQKEMYPRREDLCATLNEASECKKLLTGS